MLGTALALARKNIAVFPCRARDKRPATERGLKDATTDKDVIRRWWGERSDYNLAIATGSVSQVFVVDIDGLDAELELRKLEAAHGALPPTVEVITTRGRHCYFKMPERRYAIRRAKLLQVSTCAAMVATSSHPVSPPERPRLRVVCRQRQRICRGARLVTGQDR